MPRGSAWTTVLIARHHVPAWTVLRTPEEEFEVTLVPARHRPRGALSNLDQLRGESLNRFLRAGQVVTTHDLLPPPEYRPFLSSLRAVGLSFASLAGTARPQRDRRVDVILDYPAEERLPSRTVLEDIRVLHVEVERDEGTAARLLVTLAVTPDQQTRLVLAQSCGQLRLRVRSAGSP
jgi:Flp pilus assembly protein CpaB